MSGPGLPWSEGRQLATWVVARHLLRRGRAEQAYQLADRLDSLRRARIVSRNCRTNSRDDEGLSLKDAVSAGGHTRTVEPRPELRKQTGSSRGCAKAAS